MKERKMTQKDLAEALHWSPMRVSRLCSSGNVKLTDEDIEAVALAFGIPVETLLLHIEERAEYEPMIAQYKNSRLGVEEAARLMGKRPMFVRVALQRNQLPFGIALKGEGGRYSYYISKRKFEEYTGIKVQ